MTTHKHKPSTLKKITALVLAPLASVLIMLFADVNPGHPEATRMLAVAVLMAVWWITEIVSLAVTAFLPVILFPLLGIMDGKTVSSEYFNHIIFLFIGGFLIAIAMQKWNFHKRIALKLLSLTGTSPVRILLGFMLTTYVLSMWISNTATTMMMLPILLSVLSQLDNIYGERKISNFGIGALLAMGYSSSVGGIATLIGTPPNPIFLRIYQMYYPEGTDVTFATWFFYAFPLSVIAFAIIFIVIYFLYGKGQSKIWGKGNEIDFDNDYKALGPMTYEEKAVGVVFILTALLWMTRSPIEIGDTVIPGWSQLFRNPKFLNDGTVGMVMAFILFLIPSKKEKGSRVMQWEDAEKLPWGIIILFGGGFALAEGFKSSGLSEAVSILFQGVKGSPTILIILVITATMIFLTELTSNSSSTVIILPILASLAATTGINPLMLMIPATISASMAFMLPVATPPNAIVFSSGRFDISQMARTGLILNIIMIAVITLWSYFVTPVVFGL
jgi:sodium-dependent dicarboxylate transporter 2/3/5